MTITEEATKRALSANIARLLDERGRSGYWLMKQLNLKQGLYNVIRGDVLPSVFLAARIADALGTTVDELLYGDLENLAE